MCRDRTVDTFAHGVRERVPDITRLDLKIWRPRRYADIPARVDAYYADTTRPRTLVGVATSASWFVRHAANTERRDRMTSLSLSRAMHNASRHEVARGRASRRSWISDRARARYPDGIDCT